MHSLSVMLKPASGQCNMHCDYCFYCDEMEQRAQAMGANAVVGVSMGAEALGGDGNMLMLTVMGTAVTIRPRESGME